MYPRATVFLVSVCVGLVSGQTFGVPTGNGFFQGGGDMFGFQGGADRSTGQGGWDIFGDLQGGQNPFSMQAQHTGLDPFSGQTVAYQFDGQGMTDQLSGQNIGDQQRSITPGQRSITPGNNNQITDFGDRNANPGRAILGGGVGMPGGTVNVNVNTPEVIESAQFAVSQMGNEYDLVHIVQATQQVVSGMLYGMTIIVNRNGFFVTDNLTCEVLVHHVPWEGTRYIRSSNCVPN